MLPQSPARSNSTILRDYGPITIIFVVLMLLTQPEYFGDTWGYAQNVLKFDRRDFATTQNPLWEFGHLYWRPLGWALYRLFGWMTPYARTGEGNLAVTTFFVGVSIFSGYVSALVIQSLALRVSRRFWTATLVSTAFLCFYSFLNYVKSGAPYIPGLMFLTVAVWLTIRAADLGMSWRGAVLPGVAAGFAALMWFPYILGFPSLAAIALWWPRQQSASPRPLIGRLRAAILIIVVAVFVIATGVAIAAWQLHFASTSSFVAWVEDSSHGWSQSQRLVRMATGLPRSFLAMHDEGVMLKRFYVHDPYAHVSFSRLAVSYLWKLAIFYAFALSLICALWRNEAKPLLLVAVIAVAPVLIFATMIFEPGSPERYLSIFPFVVIAMAYALSSAAVPRLARGAVAGFALLAIALNATMLSSKAVQASYRPAAERAASLQGKVTSRGLVALVTLADDLYQFSGSDPYDPVNRRQRLPVYSVVEVANIRVLTWKQRFARRTLDTINQASDVWVSKRLLAARPDPSWKWTEGDDRRISWKDLTPVFQQFSYSEDVGGADGFLKFAPTPKNLEELQLMAAQ